MKKIFTLFTTGLMLSSAIAQNQRTVFIEELTNASCPPCAAQNPAFNALLGANTSKAVALKYQTVWPGVDPMNAQNKPDVATRVTYYGVTGVPTARVDGDTSLLISSSAYTGAPAVLDQAGIDARYATSTPIIINLTHYLNTAQDSIFIRCMIKNQSPNNVVSGIPGSLKARIALKEMTIAYNSAPGTNGETEFYNVMRKMYPASVGASGTTLSDTLHSMDSVVIMVADKLPTYIYKKGELAVVAFVQDDKNWMVYQAGESRASNLDGAIADKTVLPTSLCQSNGTPTMEISNPGVVPMTSATVSYKIGSNAWVTQAWTGNLGTGQTATVTFPTVLFPSGSQSFKAKIDNINAGAEDFNGVNNFTDPQYYSAIPQASNLITYMEGFESSSLGTAAPTNSVSQNTTGSPVYVVNKNITTGLTQNLGGYGNSNNSYRWRFFVMNSGDDASLIFNKANLTGINKVTVSWDWAHAEYDATTTDQLDVDVSKDCGTTWTTLWSKSGQNLATVADKTTGYYPAITDWKSDSVKLPTSFVNQDGIILRFKGTAGGGNNLYVDNINLHQSTPNGISAVELNSKINIYPNPTNNLVNVYLNLEEKSTTSVKVIDALGRVVAQTAAENLSIGDNHLTVNVSKLAFGNYTVIVNVNDQIIRKSIVVSN